MGSSPRVRGAALPLRLRVCSLGIIPACAGSRPRRPRARDGRRDHPRACGEQLHKIIHDTYFLGSSPRVRGAGKPVGTSKNVHGIILARAGSRQATSSPTSRSWDHPRACGEQFSFPVPLLAWLGSSPRVRGAVHRPLTTCNMLGIIPARAGSSAALMPCGRSTRDHPRACGEQVV